jgi:c-di-GMP-binding flagellar brake protein YcgR
MSNPEDRRQHVRVSLDSRYSLRFEVEGRVFRGIEMTNVSTGGVGLKLSHREAIRLQAGLTLRSIVFEHPSLPRVKVDGEVRHLIGQNLNNAEGMVLVGVQFLNPSPGVLLLIEEFIERRLGSG